MLATVRRGLVRARVALRHCKQQFSAFSTNATELPDTDLDRVCVVGTGPAGFYFARYLLREHPNVKIDMIDALPTPFGLVRTGVAPDHPEVKSVENDFDTSARESAGRLNFLGNVELGKDIQLSELRTMYNAVVLAYGAQSDCLMGIPGEDLEHSYPARQFVNWYNGHPDYKGTQVHVGITRRLSPRF